MRSVILLAALLLSGCEPHDLDVPRIESYPHAGTLVLATDYPQLPCPPDSLTNTGPHAVVLSNGERCLLLRPGESGIWSGPAEISTPDGYEK